MSIRITIDIFGIGTLKGELLRVFSPLSTDAIVNKLPIILRGRFSFGSKAYWTLPGIEIYKGNNPKSVKSVKEGDIIYNPKTDELLIILENIEMPNKVNKVGRVSENLGILLNAQNGLNTKISKAK